MSAVTPLAATLAIERRAGQVVAREKRPRGIFNVALNFDASATLDAMRCSYHPPRQEIARAGTGFLRVHRTVLEKMKDVGPSNANWSQHYVNHGSDEWEFFPVGVVNKEFLSEDWYFCDRARALGFKIMLDTRIQLRHEGVAIYPIEDTSNACV